MNFRYSMSVIIPVYRNCKTLENTILKILRSAHPSKEIIVMVDCPEAEMEYIIEKYSSQVLFDISHERRGKVNCLIRACQLAMGSAFLFLDSDIILPEKDLLVRLDKELSEYDIVELKKVVIGKNFLSRMVYYEYMGISIADWFISKSTGHTFGINGAAFAILRSSFYQVGGFNRVISEDLDLGLRCFKQGLRFNFIEDLEVYTFGPSSLSAWIKQRKRWAYGTGKWAKDNWRTIFNMVRSRPEVVLPSLLMIFPSLLALFTSLAFRSSALIYIATLLFVSFPSRSFPLLLIPLASLKGLSDLLPFFTASAICLCLYAAIYYVFGKQINMKFSLFWFVLYYLLYSPAWLVAMIWGIARAFMKDDVELDWRV